MSPIFGDLLATIIDRLQAVHFLYMKFILFSSLLGFAISGVATAAENIDKFINFSKDGRFSNASQALNCLGIDTPGVQTNLSFAKACATNLREASSKGWLGNVAFIPLAANQAPYTQAGTRNDSAAAASAAIVDVIYTNPEAKRKDSPYFFACKAQDDCEKSKFTTEEKETILGTRYDTAKLNARRALPIDKRAAAMFGYADAQLNMDITLDGATLQKTVADIRAKIPDDVLENTFLLCLANANVPATPLECAQTAARVSLKDALQSGISYSWSIKKQAQQR